MKALIRRCRGELIWLGCGAAFYLLFVLLRGNRAAMNWLARSVTGPYKRWMGRLLAGLDISLAEVLCLLAAAAFVWWLAWLIRSMASRRGRCLIAARYLLVLLCAVVTVYDGFCLLWGVNYYTDSFQQRSGIYAVAASPDRQEQLAQLTERFARELSVCASEVPRDELGLFSADRQEILRQATRQYQTLFEKFPFLAAPQQQPKAFVCSTGLSSLGYTGFFFPFTGETNLNMDSPACFLPATALHELSHQLDIASEQECNFLAIVGASESSDPVYRYSGLLMGYVHLSNALYRTDPQRWQTVRDSLPREVRLDLQSNNVYWARQESAVSRLWDKVYDRFLKSYGDTDGIQSYGTVVEMLLAYY